MRYYLDTEFIEDGKTIDLISIGIVAEDGREYYAQSAKFDASKASDWVWTHVFPHLLVCPGNSAYQAHTVPESCAVHAEHGKCNLYPLHSLPDICPWRTRTQLREELLTFMDTEKYGKPEIWTYYGAYDHVVFCQIFGTMMDLPRGFPMHTRDIKQVAELLGSPTLPGQGKGEHNALVDARWNKRALEFLEEHAYQKEQSHA